MDTWNAADAKRNFAKVLHGSINAPQVLLLRGKPVGVVVSYDSFLKNQQARGEKNLSQWLDELTAIHEVEGDMDIPPRQNRAEPFEENWE
jgi:hypothetical protein